MRKCANVSPYRRRPSVIYDSATAFILNFLKYEEILIFFYQCSKGSSLCTLLCEMLTCLHHSLSYLFPCSSVFKLAGGGRGKGGHVLLAADKMSKRKIFVLLIRPASYVQRVIIKYITRLSNVVIISDLFAAPSIFYIFILWLQSAMLYSSLYTLHKNIYSLLPNTLTQTLDSNFKNVILSNYALLKHTTSRPIQREFKVIENFYYDFMITTEKTLRHSIIFPSVSAITVNPNVLYKRL